MDTDNSGCAAEKEYLPQSHQALLMFDARTAPVCCDFQHISDAMELPPEIVPAPAQFPQSVKPPTLPQGYPIWSSENGHP